MHGAHRLAHGGHHGEGSAGPLPLWAAIVQFVFALSCLLLFTPILIGMCVIFWMVVTL